MEIKKFSISSKNRGYVIKKGRFVIENILDFLRENEITL